jgi:hypothetical protein
MDTLAIEKKINELMKENGIMGELVDYSEQKKMVAVEVIWGDWKHGHWRLDWLMQENFSNLRSIHQVTTEEDGSDCYSAIHYYYFS